MFLNNAQRQVGADNFKDAVRVTRRQVLTGALAAPGAAGLFWGYGQVDKKDPVRVAVIGTGNQGQAHIGFMNLDYLKLVAYSDIRPYNQKRAQMLINDKFGDQAKDVKFYQDYRKLLDDKSIEMVIIVLPLHLHAEATVAALQAGKHVLCEKLMAQTVTQCKQMINEADKAKRLLAIGHQRHYSYLYANCRSIIERGDVLGEVRHIRAYWHRNQTNAGAPGSEKGLYDGWFPPIPDDDKSVDFAQYGYKSIEELVRWRVYNRTGAGLMAELGSHQLDAASIFLGKTHPQAVSGFGDVLYFTDGRQVEDHIFLTFEFPKNSPAKGAVVTYSSINTNVFDGYGEQVMGTKGTLIVQEERDAYVFREPRIGEGGSMRDTRVSWAEDRVGRPVTESGSTARWVSSVETPDTLTSRGYREEQEHMAWLIRNPDKIIWPSAADPHPENDPAKAPFVPRCHGRVALADAVIALVANMAMHKHMRIEFKPEWFDPASPSNPEAEVKA